MRTYKSPSLFFSLLYSRPRFLSSLMGLRIKRREITDASIKEAHFFLASKLNAIPRQGWSFNENSHRHWCLCIWSPQTWVDSDQWRTFSLSSYFFPIKVDRTIHQFHGLRVLQGPLTQFQGFSFWWGGLPGWEIHLFLAFMRSCRGNWNFDRKEVFFFEIGSEDDFILCIFIYFRHCRISNH